MRLVLLLLLISMNQSMATTQLFGGGPAIQRNNVDSFQDFALVFPDQVFPSGTVTRWSVYIGSLFDSSLSNGIDDRVAFLALEEVALDTWKVKAVDIRTVALTSNTFDTNITIEPGWILGLYMGEARVSYDFSTNAQTVFNSPSNGGPTTAGLGSAISVGNIFTASGTLNRTYSYQVEFEESLPNTVSVPVTLWSLLGTTLLLVMIGVRRLRTL